MLSGTRQAGLRAIGPGIEAASLLLSLIATDPPAVREGL